MTVFECNFWCVCKCVVPALLTLWQQPTVEHCCFWQSIDLLPKWSVCLPQCLLLLLLQNVDRLPLDKKRHTMRGYSSFFFLFWLFSCFCTALSQALTLGGSVSFEVSCRRQATAARAQLRNWAALDFCGLQRQHPHHQMQCKTSSVPLFPTFFSFSFTLSRFIPFLIAHSTDAPCFPPRKNERRTKSSLVCPADSQDTQGERTSVVLVCVCMSFD